jgi:branched chain amino acid efflux pump
MGEGWPVLGTSLLVGTTFGVVARQSGLEWVEVVAMSVLVFAGASQFAMVRLFSESAPIPIVIASVLFINLRHLLMATSLRPQLRRLPLSRRLFAAFFLTDEAFVMATSHFRRGGRSVAYYFTFAIALFVLWNLGTVIGIVVGGVIGDPRRLGVDFAITATFIGIVVLATRNRADVIIALLAAVVAGALALAGASTIAVITAGAVTPLVAVFVRR